MSGPHSNARPKVAVITRTKNRPLALERCINSVLNQTFEDWAHVIVNDGGDPLAVELLCARFQYAYRGRLLLIHNEKSVGMQNASNIAIRRSASEYVIIHDDDDSWQPEFLGATAAFLDAAGPEGRCQGVVTHSNWVFEEIDARGEFVEVGRQDFYPPEYITLYQMTIANMFPPIAFLYRRKAHEAIGYFNETYTVLGDWDFNLRFLAQYDIGVIPQKLANYHWRRRSGESAYANTVTTGIQTHRDKAVALKNDYLREDLKHSRVGLGFLLNLGTHFEGTANRLTELLSAERATLDNTNMLKAHLHHFERITSDLARFWRMKDFMARAQGALRQRIREWRAPHAAAAAPEPAFQAVCGQAMGLLEQARAISLDVFDTALHRVVARPTDVFLFIQRDARRILRRADFPFVSARISAERMARDRAWQEAGAEDITLELIYTEFCALVRADAACAGALLELELAAERTLCFANPQALAVARAAVAKGRQLAYTSDMYLSAAFIRELLDLHGFPSAEILVSSEIGKTKHNGTMFDRLLDRLKRQPTEVLHIGDNYRSDYERPIARGLQAVHWQGTRGDLPLVDQHAAFSGANADDLMSSLYTGIVRRRRLLDASGGEPGHSPALWRALGYEMAGPLYLAFASWLLQRALSHGVKKLFFLARDGYYLAEVFKDLARKWSAPVEAEYMYASRRLLNIPRIRAMDEASLQFLITPNPGLSLRHLLERAGLDPAPFQGDLERMGAGDLDRVITTANGVFASEADHQRVRGIFTHLAPVILDRAARERERLFHYFKDIGFEPGDIAVVDLGWQASSIKALQDLLNFNGGHFKLRGLYFGAWRYARTAVEAGCLLESFFFHLDEPRHRAELVAESVELIENFFVAPCPTLVAIEKKDARWTPLYGQPEIAEEQRRHLDASAKSALEFVRDALGCLPYPGDYPAPFAYLEAVLERVLRHPRPEEVEALGDLSPRDNVGENAPHRFLARPPRALHVLFDSHALRDAYAHCFWKKGFLARLPPDQRSKLA